jgi:excisionase family DNA binding protein
MSKISSATKTFKIGEAAKYLGVSVDTLRRWEKQGKIRAEYTLGGTRIYALSQLKDIKSGTAPVAQVSPVLSAPAPLPSPAPQYFAPTQTEVVPEINTLTPPQTPAPISASSVILEPQVYESLKVSNKPWVKVTDGGIEAITKNIHLPSTFPLMVLSSWLVGLILVGSIMASYLVIPDQTKQFFASGTSEDNDSTVQSLIAAAFSPFDLLAQITLAVTAPDKYHQINQDEYSQVASDLHQTTSEYLTLNQGSLNINDNVLAGEATGRYLQINSDLVLNGSFEASGSGTFAGDLSTAGNLGVTGNGDIAGTLAVKGATTLGSTLNVSSTTTLADLVASGQVKLTGNAADTLLIQPSSNPTADTKLFTIRDASAIEKASIDAAGNLTLAGNSTVTGNGVFKGTLDVTGKTTLTTLATSDLATLATLKVTGASTLTGAVVASSTLTVSGATILSSTLAVTSAATFESTINSNTFTSTALTFAGANPLISASTAGTDLVIRSGTDGNISLQGNVGIGYTGSTSSVPEFPSLGLAVQGNIGIGTTSPNANLTVIGNAIIGSNYGSFIAPTNGLLVEGNIGIGSTGPVNYKLDVVGSARVTGSLEVNNTISNFGGSFLGPDGSFSAPTFSFNNSTSTGLWSPSLNALSLTTNSSATSGLTITSSGFVGIGLTDPGSSFQVTGNALFGYSTSASAPTNGLAVSGNLGIGTTTSNSTLTVVGNLNVGSNYSNLSAPINGAIFQGWVGIGNTAPSMSLDVVGAGRISGNIYGGGGLALGSAYYNYTPPPNGLLVQGNTGIGTTATSMALFSLGGNAIVGSGWVSSQAAPSNGLLVEGNVGIGATWTNTYALSVGGNIGVGGHIIPEGGNRNLGSTGNRWSTVYADTIDATTIAGVIAGGSTNSADWTINADNASADTETMSLAFERGSLTPNAVLRWDTGTKYFNLNSTLLVGSTSQDSYISNTLGLVLSDTVFDITTQNNEHLSLVPNGTGNVGIGTTSPGSKLAVNGNLSVGSTYGGIAAPTNGAIFEGNVGIGISTPMDLGTGATVSKLLHINSGATTASQVSLSSSALALTQPWEM